VLEADAARISPRLKGEKTRDALLAKAAIIPDEQVTRAAQHEEPIGRAEVAARLLDGSRPSNRLLAAPLSVIGANGEPLLTLRGSNASGGIAVLLHRHDEDVWPALAEGLQRLLAAHKEGTRGAVPLTAS
jgi:hypothetical protein